MITENLATLKINKLTQEQYNRELKAGNIKEDELYLTPVGDIDIDLTNYYTKEEIDGMIGNVEDAFVEIAEEQESIIAAMDALIGGETI